MRNAARLVRRQRGVNEGLRMLDEDVAQGLAPDDGAQERKLRRAALRLAVACDGSALDGLDTDERRAVADMAMSMRRRWSAHRRPR